MVGGSGNWLFIHFLPPQAQGDCLMAAKRNGIRNIHDTASPPWMRRSEWVDACGENERNCWLLHTHMHRDCVLGVTWLHWRHIHSKPIASSSLSHYQNAHYFSAPHIFLPRTLFQLSLNILVHPLEPNSSLIIYSLLFLSFVLGKDTLTLPQSPPPPPPLLVYYDLFVTPGLPLPVLYSSPL